MTLPFSSARVALHVVMADNSLQQVGNTQVHSSKHGRFEVSDTAGRVIGPTAGLLVNAVVASNTAIFENGLLVDMTPDYIGFRESDSIEQSHYAVPIINHRNRVVGVLYAAFQSLTTAEEGIAYVLEHGLDGLNPEFTVFTKFQFNIDRYLSNKYSTLDKRFATLSDTKLTLDVFK